jgi:hypothetical protein
MKNESLDLEVTTNTGTPQKDINRDFNIQMSSYNNEMDLNLNDLSAGLSFIENNCNEGFSESNSFMNRHLVAGDEDSIRVSYNKSLSLSEDFDSYCSSEVEVMPLWLLKELSKVKPSQNTTAEYRFGSFKNAYVAAINDPMSYDCSLSVDEDLKQEPKPLKQVQLTSECFSSVHQYQISPMCIFMKGVSEDTYKPSDVSKDTNKQHCKVRRSKKIQRTTTPDSESSESNLYSVKPVVKSRKPKNRRNKKKASKRSKKFWAEVSPKNSIITSETYSVNNNNVRKRTKLLSSGESSSKNTINLATRRDVVNKTILRVLRRYLTTKFKNEVEPVYEGKTDKHTKYFAYVKKLAILMFGESHPQIKLLHFYLASIIDHKYMTDEDVEESGAGSEDLTIFYNWLYKYSHTRMVNLLHVGPIGQIYEKFYEEAKDSVLLNEVSLSKNKKLYSKVMDEFLYVYLGELDISSLVI